MGQAKLFDLQEILSGKDENSKFSQKVSHQKSLLYKKRKHWDQISFEGIERKWGWYQKNKEHSWDRKCSDKKEPGGFLQPIFKRTAWRKDKLVGIRQFFTLDLQIIMGWNSAFNIQAIAKRKVKGWQNLQIPSGRFSNFGAKW